MLKKYIFISLLCFTQKFIASDSRFFNTDQELVLLNTNQQDVKRLSTLKDRPFAELLYENQFGNSSEKHVDEEDILDEANIFSTTIIVTRNGNDSARQQSQYLELAREDRPEMLDEENMMGTDTDLENQKKLKENSDKKF